MIQYDGLREKVRKAIARQRLPISSSLGFGCVSAIAPATPTESKNPAFCAAISTPICDAVRPMSRAADPISAPPTPRKNIATKDEAVMILMLRIKKELRITSDDAAWAPR